MDHLLTPARSQSMRPHWGYVPPSHGLRHALTRGHRADCALSRPRRHRPGDGVCPTDFNVGPRFASGARSDPAPSLATCFTDDRNVLREGIETVVTNGPLQPGSIGGTTHGGRLPPSGRARIYHRIFRWISAFC